MFIFVFTFHYRTGNKLNKNTQFYLDRGQEEVFQRKQSITKYISTIQTMGTANEEMKKLTWNPRRL